MTNFSKRLRIFMQEEGITPNQLTVRSGMSNGLIGRVVRDGKGLTTENLEKILKAFPDLSADWLLMGRGPMYIKRASPEQSEANESPTITASSPPTPTAKTPTHPPASKTPTQPPGATAPTPPLTDANLITTLVDTIRQQAIEIGMLRARLQQASPVPSEPVADPLSDQVADHLSDHLSEQLAE